MNETISRGRIWSRRLAAILFSGICLTLFSCIYWPINFEPCPWDSDSSAFYFFRSNERQVKLIRYVVDSGEEVVVADLGTIGQWATDSKSPYIGAARFLPVSGDFVWLQRGSSQKTGQGGSAKSSDGIYLVNFSLESKKVKKEHVKNSVLNSII